MADSRDNSLVKNTLLGDAESFRMLVDRYKNPLIKVAYHLTRNRDEAEELAQETFVRAYENLEKFDPEKSFFTWLYTICTNLNINTLKRKGRILYEGEWPNSNYDNNNNGDNEPVPADSRFFGALAEGEQRIEEKRNKKLLDDLLHRISDEYRTAVILRYQEELSYQEIAQYLGISISAAKVRVHRGVEKLRTFLLSERENAQ